MASFSPSIWRKAWWVSTRLLQHTRIVNVVSGFGAGGQQSLGKPIEDRKKGGHRYLNVATQISRGHRVAASSPALSAAGFDPCSNSTTRTPGTLRAISVVSSVQPCTPPPAR